MNNQLFIPITREGKAYLLKTDINGKTIWEKAIGSGEAIRAKQDANGNIYFISGTFETGCRISKLDENAKIAWSIQPNTSGGDWYQSPPDVFGWILQAILAFSSSLLMRQPVSNVPLIK